MIGLALALPDAEGQLAPVPAWAPQSVIAAQATLSSPYVASLLAQARERWTKSLPAVTALRKTVREILHQHGRVMESGHLAAALLAQRGCALGDATARLAVAEACLRAAITTEEHLENPRLAQRRSPYENVLIASVVEGDPNLPTEEELFDYAVSLGAAADELVNLADGEPLPGGAAARQRLAEVERPAGMPALADTDLVALAVGASKDAAMTARLELYPRSLSPARALQLSQAASYLADPGIEPDQLRERVLARFPALANNLPEPGELRKILIGLGHRVDVTIGADGKQRYRVPGGTLVPAWSSTRGATSLSRDGNAWREAEARLRTAIQRGGFLVVKCRVNEAVAVTAELARMDGVTSAPIARLFVSALRDLVTHRGKPRWESVLAADSPDAAPTAQVGFGKLVDTAWEKIGAHVRAQPEVVLLHDATPIARYPGGMELLTRLASGARQADEPPHGPWLLCPMEDPRQPALLSPRALGAAIAGQAAALTNHSTKRGPLGPLKPTGGRLGLPAEFLIAPRRADHRAQLRTARLRPVDRRRTPRPHSSRDRLIRGPGRHQRSYLPITWAASRSEIKPRSATNVCLCWRSDGSAASVGGMSAPCLR